MKPPRIRATNSTTEKAMTTAVYGTRVRNQRILRLKEELGVQLELVVRARESLQAEVSGDGLAGQMLSLDNNWMRKLKDLTSCFNTLTDSRIRLDNAEKKQENDMTPAEERDACVQFILALDSPERKSIINYLTAQHDSMDGRLK